MRKINNLVKIVLGSFLLFSPIKNVLAQDFQNIKKKSVIVLDPGHGGNELGYNKRPLKESNLNLNVSKLIEKKLNKNYSVSLTRKVDSCVNRDSINYNMEKEINLSDELISRIEFAKNKNSDYFLSIHFNGSRDTSKKGIQIFYPAIYNKKSINNNQTDFCSNSSDCWSYSEKSYAFAEDLSNFFKMNGFEVEVRGADYGVLIGIQSEYSKKIKYPLEKNVLLELGYMSNDEEYNYIISKEGQERYSSLVAEYFNILKPEKLELKKFKINYDKQIP